MLSITVPAQYLTTVSIHRCDGLMDICHAAYYIRWVYMLYDDGGDDDTSGIVFRDRVH